METEAEQTIKKGDLTVEKTLENKAHLVSERTNDDGTVDVKIQDIEMMGGKLL